MILPAYSVGLHHLRFDGSTRIYLIMRAILRLALATVVSSAFFVVCPPIEAALRSRTVVS